MAIEQTAPTAPAESTAVPAIENEFPTYRAISPKAVLSLVLGLFSVFCFADLWFLLLVGGSVGLGLLALRQIRERPEVLTGAGLARVGIGVGLLFGLTALTQVITQEVTINIDAGQFARSYITVIKDEPVSVALWYQQNPAYRKEKNPDQLVDEMKKTRNPAAGDPYQQKADPIQKIKELLKGQGTTLRYDQVESKAVDGLTTYANALLTLDGPGVKEEQRHALLQMVRNPDAERLEWVVKELHYPYTPKSEMAVVVKKVDDGHGH